MHTEPLAHPARPVRFTRLVEIDGSRTFPLPRKILLVGSSALCTIQLPDPGIQEQHAYLLERDGKWFVKPILARCQCRINETLIRDEAPIVHGDILEFQGTVAFRFLTRDPATAESVRTPAVREPSEFHGLFGELLRAPDLESSLEILVKSLSETFQAHRATLLECHPDGSSEFRAAHPPSDSSKASRIKVLIPAEEQNTTLALKALDPPSNFGHPEGHPEPESVLTAPLGEHRGSQGCFFLILERDAGRPAFSSDETAHLESVRVLLGEILGLVRSRQSLADRLSLAEGNAPIPSTLVCRSPAMTGLLEQARSLADQDRPLWIAGESGCGKVDLVRWLHGSSTRRGAPLRILRPHDRSASALAQELFGPDPASDTLLSEIHSGGTVLLESVEHLPPTLQTRLAAALSRHRDASMPPAPPTRWVLTSRFDPASCTDLDPALRVALDPDVLVIPPVRERPEDILLVATHLIRRLSNRLGVPTPKIGHRAERWLLSQAWTGNVAELEHVLAAACVRCDGPTLRPEHLQPDPAGTEEATPAAEPARVLPSLEAARESAERAICSQALARTRGNVVRAAELLDTDRRTLQRILDRIELDARAFRTPGR